MNVLFMMGLKLTATISFTIKTDRSFGKIKWNKNSPMRRRRVGAPVHTPSSSFTWLSIWTEAAGTRLCTRCRLVAVSIERVLGPRAPSHLLCEKTTGGGTRAERRCRPQWESRRDAAGGLWAACRRSCCSSARAAITRSDDTPDFLSWEPTAVSCLLAPGSWRFRPHRPDWHPIRYPHNYTFHLCFLRQSKLPCTHIIQILIHFSTHYIHTPDHIYLNIFGDFWNLFILLNVSITAFHSKQQMRI